MKSLWTKIISAIFTTGPIIGLGVVALLVSYRMIARTVTNWELLLHDAGFALVIVGLVAASELVGGGS